MNGNCDVDKIVQVIQYSDISATMHDSTSDLSHLTLDSGPAVESSRQIRKHDTDTYMYKNKHNTELQQTAPKDTKDMQIFPTECRK